MQSCFRPDVMNQGVVFTLALALGIAGVALWLWRRQDFFGKRHFLISLIAMALWLIGCMMEMSQLSLACKLFWASASWPLIVLLPTAWSFFIMEYCFPGQARRVRLAKRFFLLGGPLVTLAVVVTNPAHRLFYGPATRLVQDGGRATAVYDHGPLFYATAAYLYLFLGYAVAQTLAGAILTRERFRLFFIGLFIITSVPAAANFAYVGFGVTIYGFDPTPYAFSGVLTVLAWMIANNRLMDTDAMVRDVLFYSVPDPVLLVGPGGNILSANPEARRLIGDDLSQNGLPAGTCAWLTPLVATITSGRFRDDAGPLRIGAREYSLSLAPMPRPIGDRGTPVGWVLRLHDITQRLQLQRALDAERDLQATLTETSFSGLIAIDDTGAYVFANAEAERILGIRLAGKQRVSITDAEWQAREPDGSEIANLGDLIDAMLRNKPVMRDRRLSILRRSDGMRRILSMNVTPLRLENRRNLHAVLSVADITEQYNHELHLHEAVARAEAASLAKSRFLANMSHEIRTPLNGVLGMAEVLSHSVTGSEQKRMVATIRDSGELLLALLNDILDMSRIEAGKMTLEALPFDPQEVVARIDGLFWPQAEARGLAFEAMVPGGRLRLRIGDPLRLQQVLQNLVGNAIKFTPLGEVRLTAADLDDGALSIEVRDTGIGMTAEQVARIFDEFEQADGSTTRRFGGSGLGMSILRHLVDAMGGSVAIDSAPGKGTLVRLHLPLPLAAAEEAVG